MAVGGYDGMHLIYEALKKTNGKADGDALIAAMKGMKWESPRGPISIDPETRDVIHNEYLRHGREGERAALQCRERDLPGQSRTPVRPRSKVISQGVAPRGPVSAPRGLSFKGAFAR